MRNVKEHQLKKAIVLSVEEYEEVLHEIFGVRIIVHADLDGIWYEFENDNEYNEDIDTALVENLAIYFDVNEITSIHCDDCDYCGIWIIYQ